MTAPVWRPAPGDEEVLPRLERAFSDAFGAAPDGVWAAPGRVNLIGEHVDYHGGLCLPLALPHRTRVAVRLRDDDTVRVVSAQEPDGWHGRLEDVGPGRPQGWAAYAVGVLWALRHSGSDVPGVDIAVDGAVPLGAGLSSSAALECAVAVAVADMLGLPGSEPQDDAGRASLAQACVRAENDVAGAPTGGMDQAVALRAREGHALLLDARDGGVEHVPLDLAASGLALLVVETRAPHRLVDGQYAQRRRTGEDAATILGVASLREVADADGLPQLEDELARRRVRHVVTEIRRVRELAHMLGAGRVRGVGPLLDASHASLRDDYEVSSPELDIAVEAARSAGALGSRMTGGGFGGSAIALVEAAAVEETAREVVRRFAAAGRRPPAFLQAEAAGPAARVRW